MHVDPLLPVAVEMLVAILLLAVILKRLKQPYVIGYLVAGVLLGLHGQGLIADQAAQERLSAIGVVLLLFFIGMEVSSRRLVSGWKVAVIGTVAQIGSSVVIAWPIGLVLDWPLARSVLMGFVISLSSTAVVLKMLQDWGEIDTDTGQDVLGVLLFQDMAVMTMLIGLAFMSGDRPDLGALALQGTGGVLILALMVPVLVKDSINLPLARWLKEDTEMQVCAAPIVCFRLATLTGMFRLSTALGAFVDRMVIGSA
jgi:CPA2 family monovalent cation:H+ antiporter-2